MKSFYKGKIVFCQVSMSGLSQAGGWGFPFLAKQLTLSQLGGQIMPTTVIQAPPPGFCDGPVCDYSGA